MRKYITKRRVLKWINEYRTNELYRINKELEPLDKIPKGKRRSSCSCPISRATELLVDGTHLVDPSVGNTELENIVCDLPQFVRQFIDDFDEGKYPELELHD